MKKLHLYTNYLKNQEMENSKAAEMQSPAGPSFDVEAPQIFCPERPGASKNPSSFGVGRAVFMNTTRNEDEKYEAKPTQLGAPKERFVHWGKALAKTSFSSCLGLLLIFLLFTTFSSPLFSKENQYLQNHIASFSPTATYVIPFYMTRSLTDGALKSELLRQLQSIFNIQVFIESGTYLGNTVEQAVPLFKKIYSIELSPLLAGKAKRKFKKQDHITILRGDSGSILRVILPVISSKILFYLDGHYSGGATAMGSMNTPVMEELAAIRDCGITDGIILIDDIRGFQDSLYPEKIVNTCLEGYPDLDQLSRALLEINSKYKICFLGDSLLAYPEDPNVAVSPVVAACTLHHFTTIYSEISEELLRNADSYIMNAQEFEKEQLIEYYKAYSDFEMKYGFRCFGALWYGLLLYGDGKIEDARQIFKQAAECSLPGWHIEQLQKNL